MDIKQINTSIIQGNWTNDQLTSIIDAVRFARSQLVQQIKYSLRAGDNVSFTSSKTKRSVTGVVTKVAVKYVTVRTADGLWKVPANMLSKEETVV